MRNFYVLASYPPTKVSPERRRATIIGSMEVGKDDGLDDYASAYVQLLELLKEVNGGQDMVDHKKSTPYTKVVLKNGVIFYLDLPSAEPLEKWLRAGSIFSGLQQGD